MKLKILCIDDDTDFLISVRMQLRETYAVSTAGSIEEGIIALRRDAVDLVLLDVGLGDEDGIEGIRRICHAHPSANIAMLSGRRDPKTVVGALRAGAVDYLTKPIDRDELEAIITRQEQTRRVRERYAALVETQNCDDHRKHIIYTGDVIHQVLAQADQLKGHQANVLIVGETGTGKDLLARYIHRREGDSARPFIAVNCAAIPENLLEAELFGSEPGAYTGSVKRRIGRFELADGGDIFLDEIGALKLDLQAKILRVLQEGEFCRVGGNETIRADFRVISATNDLLEERVSRGEFRMDLYHRLRVIQLAMPPLRERIEDIPALVDHFLSQFVVHDVVKRMSAGAMGRLMAYHWPGNVRELANVVQSLTILAPGEVIEESIFPSWALNGCGSPACDGDHVPLPQQHATVATLKAYVARAERHVIEQTLHVVSGDKSKAAKRLEIGRTTLYAKMKELGMM